MQNRSSHHTRGEKMLSCLGIRLRKQGADGNWNVISQNLGSHNSPGPQTSSLTENEAVDSPGGSEDSPVFDDSDADPDYVDSDNAPSSRNDSHSDEENQLLNLEDTNVTPTKSRKRKAKPSEWKRNNRKFLRNTGREYKNVVGAVVPARIMHPPCGASCRLKCTEKFTLEERTIFHNKYWALGDINEQRNFIARSMSTVTPKYRYNVARNDATSGRDYNHAFYLYKAHESKERVCKKFFVATLGITDRNIRTVIAKLKNGFVSNDGRGKHSNHRRVSDEMMTEVRAHLSSIPTVDSHYCRSSTSKQYIQGGKTLTDLYTDYKADCINANRAFVKIGVYRDLFNFEFNYSFYTPKKDQCQLCETWKHSSDAEKNITIAKYNKHHAEKVLVRELKVKDKEKINNRYKVACFDLEAALPTPRGEVSSFYYKSKLSTYNFTVCELNKEGLGEVYSYVWHEGEGNKGSIEIGSCLLNYLEKTAAQVDSDDFEVVFYTDNCGGQGKNKFIITMYLYAVTHFKIKSITHRYLVVGHTQNEGDCTHSLIERNIKKALKSGPIYLPSQYAMLIGTARRNNPFKVHEMCHEDFFDLKEVNKNTAITFNEDVTDTQFNFNDICEIRVERGNSTHFFFKTSFEEKQYRCVDTTKTKRRVRLANIANQELQKAYQETLSITKKKDLLSLVNSKVIPPLHASFYHNLRSSEV